MMSIVDFTQKARPYVVAAVAARRAAGDLNVEAYEPNATDLTPTGCDGHPSLLIHSAMAEELALKIKPILGW